MKIKVIYKRTAIHEAVIEAPDEDVFREWLRESGAPDQPITAELVKEWYEAGDPNEWIDAIMPGRHNEIGVADVDLEDVEII